MIEAYKLQDEKSYNRYFEYLNRQFRLLQGIAADLVYYGRFTLQDVNQMKVIERRIQIKEINDRLEAIEKARNKGK